MKRNYAILMASLFMAGACCSCSEKEEMATTGDNYIQFTMGGSDSRTVRDENDKYQFLWEKGDSVRVYCAEASTDGNLHYANYAVVPDASDAKKGKLAFNKDGLRWSADKSENHYFYAVYPDTAVFNYQGDGVVKFGHIFGGVFNEAEVDGVFVQSDKVDRMVAYNGDNTYNGAVPLNFKPIMTTLDVTMKNTTSHTVVTSNSAYIEIPNVPYNADYITYPGDTWRYDHETFNYNIKTGEISGSKTFDTFTYNIYLTSDLRPNYWHGLSLAPGDSIRVVAQLPPVAIGAERQIIVGQISQNSSNYFFRWKIGGETQNGHSVECKAGGYLSVKLYYK